MFTLRKQYIYTILFEGISVIAVQLLAVLYIAAYWGNTYSFWILSTASSALAMSIGYFLAQPLAKGKTEASVHKMLLFIVVVFLAYIQLVYLNAAAILEKSIYLTDNPLLGEAIALGIFNFLPIVLLCTLPPLVIQLRESHKSTSEGSITGIVYGISSGGAVVSVLLIVGVLSISRALIVPFMVISNMLLLLGLLINAKIGGVATRIAILVLLVMANLAWLKKSTHHPKKQGRWTELTKMEGMQGELKVLRDNELSAKYVMINNVSQTKTHTTGRSLYSYVYSLAIYSTVAPPHSKVLLAGVAGGNLIYELVNQQFDVDAVDIDKRHIEIAKEHFLLPTFGYQFFHTDIRRYIKTTHKKYDVIILDLSYGETVPTNVFTQEAFEEMRGILAPNGIVLIHYVASLDPQGFHSLASVMQTIKATGLDCKVINRDNINKERLEDLATEKDQYNVILAASEKIDFSDKLFRIDPSVPQDLYPRKDRFFMAFDDEHGEVLTDDRSPLEMFQMETSMKLRRENIQWMKRRKDADE